MSAAPTHHRNAVAHRLAELGVIDPAAVAPYHQGVRDDAAMAVLRCGASGVVFLESTDHVDIEYYIEKDAGRNEVATTAAPIPIDKIEDAARQAEAFAPFIAGRRWLDYGCGAGLLLERLGPQAVTACGVEPNRGHRDAAAGRGVTMYADLDAVPAGEFDVITLFHVFEHLADPVALAAQLRRRLAPNGRLVVEVPHARDVLLTTLDCEDFRRFTLWSEHLVLHTRDSLAALLRAAGFSSVEVRGYQRYPLPNHLYWLRHGKPGGHKHWAFLDDPALHAAYAAALERNDQTDTVIGLATP